MQGGQEKSVDGLWHESDIYSTGATDRSKEEALGVKSHTWYLRFIVHLLQP